MGCDTVVWQVLALTAIFITLCVQYTGLRRRRRQLYLSHEDEGEGKRRRHPSSRPTGLYNMCRREKPSALLYREAYSNWLVLSFFLISAV